MSEVSRKLVKLTLLNQVSRRKSTKETGEEQTPAALYRMKNDRMNIGKVYNAWIGSIRRRNMIKHDMTPGPQQTAVNIQFAIGEWGNMR